MTEDAKINGNYAINLCPDEEKMPKLKEYVSYVVEQENSDGTKAKVYTAKDMHVTLYKFRDVEASFEFEAVLYLNDLIKNCMSAAN